MLWQIEEIVEKFSVFLIDKDLDSFESIFLLFEKELDKEIKDFFILYKKKIEELCLNEYNLYKSYRSFLC